MSRDGFGRDPAHPFESACPRPGPRRDDPQTGNAVPRSGEPTGFEAKGPSPRPSPVPLLEGLERVRECLRQRLDQIEELARRRDESPSPGSSDRERELRGRIAQLEEAQARSRHEAERREEQGREAIDQLEEDRRQLAEAWERLEQEQIAVVRVAHGVHPPAPAPGQAVPATAPPLRVDATPEGENPIEQGILKQFQALRRDVRRNAHELHRG